MGAKIQIATAREVAAVLRLRESTVCRLASQGKLPGLKLGKSWRFDMGRVERLFYGIPRAGKDRPEGDQENFRKDGG
ncbi:MAG: hypothetical protein C0390_09570 [Syntrophus sp. (in: bacteria)]|nr:hypothetical protein [Syntrophus sp. (in: bacteria)]